MTLDAIRIEDRCVVLPDRNSFQWHIPLRVLPAVYERAVREDVDAWYDGRWFTRVALEQAMELLPRCENRAGLWECDGAGVNVMSDGERFCDSCCSAAQGSSHDDRIEAL